MLKSLMLLWSRIATESAIRCCTSATMDLKTVRGRCEHEGLSFLTIALPAFGKDFEKSLDLGLADRRLFSGFRRKGELPVFLGGFLDRVFDRSSGLLLDHPDIDAILAVRQLTLMFGKLLVPCSDMRDRRAMSGYVKCEKEVRASDTELGPRNLEDFRRVASLLFRDVFTDVDREIYAGNAVPKHGPGATADKLTGNRKFQQNTWPERLEEIFPALDNLFPSWSYYDQLQDVDFLEPGSEVPVRVITVPKTLKTPRIIGIEPTAMQYMQQAVSRLIVDRIEGDRILSPMIGFDDQTPNQRMARQGSLTRDLATLDLSEASDRVSNQLVREMVRHWPHLHKALDATRSRKADVPGHGVIRLAKYASMGSALCFPVEAMVFTTVIFLGIERELNRPLSPKVIRDFRDKVRVYGDDIICPVEYVRSVVETLETFGFRVNLAKSFWNGKFRESCGKEYYEGQDISIVRVRREFPTQPKHATRVISMVSLRNQLYFAGYWDTCRWLDEEIIGVIRYFPVVSPSSRVLGRHSFLGYQIQGVDDALQRPFVKGYVVSAKLPSDILDGYAALLKFFLKSERRKPFGEEGSGRDIGHLVGQPANGKHLERAGRPQSVDIKLRRACPY